MNEIWKPISGFGEKYEVSNFGSVRSVEHVRIRKSRFGNEYPATFAGLTLKQKKSLDGRMQVCLSGGGVKKFISVHRLVLCAFVGPCPSGMEACHNNGNCVDNRLENLRWDSRQSNLQDRKTHKSDVRGEDHPRAKLNWSAVDEIRKLPKFGKKEAAKFGIDVSVGHKIRRNALWKKQTEANLFP